MTLIDTHTHLYLKDYIADPEAHIERAIQQGVEKMLVPHINRRTSEELHRLCHTHPGVLYPMIGIHPTSIKENYSDELRLVEEKLVSGTQYCAVGEIGLDLYWDTTHQKEQEIAFRQQIELALAFDLPVAIHTRKATTETIAVVKDYTHRGLRGVFHCFPGTVEEAKIVTSLGFYLGIGGVVTYKNSDMARVVEALPLETLLLETDAPFLSPVPKRGETNESAYTLYVAQKIATIKNISLEEVAHSTTLQATKLFNL